MPEMIPVTSSNIDSVGYEEENEILFIKFKSGKVYTYEKVPVHVYDELMTAESVGKYFNQCIKNQYITKVETS